MKDKRNSIILAILAFGMYFITGVVCMLMGSLLTSLKDLYGLPIEKIVLIGSAFAAGRVCTVYFTGRLVEKVNVLKVIFAGICFMGAYLLGIVMIPSYYLAFGFAFLGGVGMGIEDTTCPLLLSHVFTKGYSSALSAGQALYGLGCFSMSLLVGLMFSLKLSVYTANYILSIVFVILLALIPFARFEKKQNMDMEEETIKPLYTRYEFIGYAILGVICFIYCGLCSLIGTYTSSYGEMLGIASDKATYMLTIYNIGAVIGSIIFIFVLRKLSEKFVLIMNSTVGIIMMILMLQPHSAEFYYPVLMIAGMFLGVMFSLILALVTRIGYQHISIASSIIAVTGGAGDIVTPIISGYMISLYTAAVAFKMAMWLLIIILILGIIIYCITKEEDVYGNSK